MRAARPRPAPRPAGGRTANLLAVGARRYRAYPPEYSRVLKGKERLRAGRSAADTMGLSGVLRQLTARAASMAPAATELAAVALGKSL